MIHVAVVGHVSRQARAEALAGKLGAELFLDRLTLGSTHNHLRALNWGAELDGHLVVLEDDALPVDGFLTLAASYLDRFPDRVLSWYLGTDTRPHQRFIPGWLELAEREGRDWCAHPKLLHAVSYAMSCDMVRSLTYKATRFAADEMISEALRSAEAGPVIYTIPSLVDHADEQSIENPNRGVARKAWRIATLTA